MTHDVLSAAPPATKQPKEALINDKIHQKKTSVGYLKEILRFSCQVHRPTSFFLVKFLEVKSNRKNMIGEKTRISRELGESSRKRPTQFCNKNNYY
jgi:hypothetical protein